MKTASLQPINTLLNNRIFTSYHIEFNPLTNIYTYLMKKLSDVSPFIMLLVPVFMMFILTLSQGNHAPISQNAESKKTVEINSKITNIQAPVK